MFLPGKSDSFVDFSFVNFSFGVRGAEVLGAELVTKSAMLAMLGVEVVLAIFARSFFASSGSLFLLRESFGRSREVSFQSPVAGLIGLPVGGQECH